MKIYHLSTCTTCQRILKEIGSLSNVELQDIKSNPVTDTQLEQMYEITKSYESLFSKRAMKYRSMGLNEMNLSEKDYKKYLLQEYTFLKRPVAIIGDQLFAGSAKKTVAELKEALAKKR